MNKITLPKAAHITSPNPVTVVCTQKPDGRTYLSYNPNMIAYAMAKTSFSGEMVRRHKKVVLTVPGEKIAEAVLGCGSTTGRDTDKIEKFGIETQVLTESEIRVPLHSALAIVCTLKEFLETGDHYLYICNVEHVYADEKENALFAWNGYSEIAPAKKAIN